MKSLGMRIFFLLMVFVFGGVTLQAAKVKSSDSYLKTFEAKVQPLAKNLDTLKTMLSSVQLSKSFVTTDFWGLEPSWYVSGTAPKKLTVSYPYASAWLNGYGIWKKYSSGLVRNINGVVLTPLNNRNMRFGRKDPRGWVERLSISFDYSPGYSDDRYEKYVRNHLKSSGVPQSKMNEAMNYFMAKADQAIRLISDQIYHRFDTLYSGVAKNGERSTYENIAIKLDKKSMINIDDYVTPLKHSDIFTKELFAQYDHQLYVTSRKAMNAEFDRWAGKASMYEYYRNDFSLEIDVPLQYFEVAKGMSKSDKYNQLQALKSMLDKKVQSGKVKVFKKANYTVYQDAFDKYTRGQIAVDFKTGVGYWQLPVWDERKQFQHSFKKIKQDEKDVNTALERYLAMSLNDTVKKYRSNGAQTSDF
jgi:hypothetical protein